MRDTKTGMLFLGYSDELSELNARTMIDYVLLGIKNAVGDRKLNSIVQTDNGSEFSGQARWFETSTFSKGVHRHSAEHVYIRPGHKNAQADVESSHRLIEEEFYDHTLHKSRDDFLLNAEAYRLFFNLIRPNYSKGARTPWAIMQEDWVGSNVASKTAMLPTLDLDKIAKPISLESRGQSIPVLSDLIYVM